MPRLSFIFGALIGLTALSTSIYADDYIEEIDHGYILAAVFDENVETQLESVEIVHASEKNDQPILAEDRVLCHGHHTKKEERPVPLEAGGFLSNNNGN